MVEDETSVGDRIERFTRDYMGDKIAALKRFETLDDAIDYLSYSEIDLLLLDLNLHGQDGFDVLRQTASGAYHTIIVSAYAERAINAFEYGVLDFVAKPFGRRRFDQALDRFLSQRRSIQPTTRYLTSKHEGKVEIIDLDDVNYIRGADYNSEIVMKDETCKIHSKTLARLLMILPPNFARIHKSYVANMSGAICILKHPGSRYELILGDGTHLPVGRAKYRELMTEYFKS